MEHEVSEVRTAKSGIMFRKIAICSCGKRMSNLVKFADDLSPALIRRIEAHQKEAGK